MFELHRLSPAAVPRAIAKAERYRLLDEPFQAESICLDVLETETDNQQALVTLLLALTDAFSRSPGIDLRRPTELLPRLRDPYDRHYYQGIIHERWGRAMLARQMPVHVSLGWLREAMRAYERAIELAPPANEDAILRWNACARLFAREEEAHEPVHTTMTAEPDQDDETPPRQRRDPNR